MTEQTDTLGPERLPLNSRDLTADRVAQPKTLFPEVFREDEIDFDALRRSLGSRTVEPGRERFGLSWPGKADCMRIIQQPSLGTLIPDRDESVHFDTTQNVVVEGDNLEVLKMLQNSYYGKVKMIYIDPPYNTGSDFIYLDKYAESLKEYLRYSGQVNENGHKQTTNPDTSGQFHSKWLNMMYPRLFLARNLLRDDGVIFVSIDDAEFSHLRSLLDELFGESNFVETIIWKKRSTPPNDQIVGANHDYIVIYSKNREVAKLNLRQRSDEQVARYRNPDHHPKGPWTAGDLMANVKGGRYVASLHYPITNPTTGQEHYPSSNGNWRFSQARIKQLIASEEIFFGDDNRGRPKLKRFLSDVKQGVTYPTIWDFVPLNTSGSSEMASIFGDQNTFESPKPSGLLTELLTLGSSGDDVVLDFFAGSGTTGHAVMKLNAEDGGNRRYILIQLPEPLDNGGPYRTISEITRERLRRAGAQVREQAAKDGRDVSGLDTGFQAYSLAESNFRQWDGRASDGQAVEQQLQLLKDNVREDRSPRAILSELVLAAGFELTTRVERIAVGNEHAWSIADGALLICLERRIEAATIAAMAERDPAQIICLDASFAGDDQLRVNAAQTIRARARQHDRTIAFKVV